MSALIQRQVKITNDLGLHLRAAGILVQVASRFNCDIWLRRGTTDANAKSIMSVLALAAGKGTELVVVARGDDAQEAVCSVADLIDRGFKN